MARRRGSARRRRRGGSGFLYKLLSVFLICGCLVAAITLFFRVDTVVITGEKRYTEAEIRQASGVEDGDNLFLLNKYQVIRNIAEALPYIEIENTRIQRKLPDTLLIQVQECGDPLAWTQDGTVWLMSPAGKIVEQTDTAAGHPTVDGCELLAPSMGTDIALSTEFANQQTSLLALLAAVCLLCGAINGLLVLAAGLPPLLATLSTSVAFTGLTDLLTGQRRIAVSDPLMVAFRDNSVLGLPWPLVYLLGVFILFQFLLHHSRFGQHVQAVGGNRDMAQMSGLNVRRLTLLVWLLAGIAAGLAILPLLSQGSGSSSGTATPLLLETVLATFIGAAFSRRRVVTIWGALLGAILVNALSNGLGLLGVNIFWMGAIKGGLILVVLAASAVRHKGGEA